MAWQSRRIFQVFMRVLDSGANLLVGAAVFLLPGRELFALAATVWHDQTGALVAAVGNRHRVAAGVGVDDHLMSG